MYVTAMALGRYLIPRRLLLSTTLIFTILSSLSGCSLLQSAGQSVGLLDKPESQAETALPLSEQPYQITLNISGSDNMNPNSNRLASPAQVRLFVIEPSVKVDEKPFEEVFDYSGSTMQPRPLRKVTVRPGEDLTIDLPAMKSQTRLVVAVAFRDPYQSIWLAQADIIPLDSVTANARIDADRVSILPSP